MEKKPRIRLRLRSWVEIDTAIPVPTFELTFRVGRLTTVIAPFSPWAWRRWGIYDYPPTWHERKDVFKWGPIVRERALGPVTFKRFPFEERHDGA